MRISIAEETVRKILERERRIRELLVALHLSQPIQFTKEERAKIMAAIEDENQP